ncbi:MAG: hypothetical protein AAFV93_12370 [Chloroflexota bacterium]
MTWLKKRLKELEYTHNDLQKALEEKGIKRVRATITGWTNDKPVSLLNNPEDAKKLADVLDWTVLELLVAAGYDIDIPAELSEIIEVYRNADAQKQQNLILGWYFFISFYEDNSTQEDDS